MTVVIREEFPGFSKDEIHVKIFGNTIEINAAKKQEKRGITKNSFFHSIASGRVSKSFTFPWIDKENVDVKIEDGRVIILAKKKKKLKKYA